MDGERAMALAAFSASQRDWLAKVVTTILIAACLLWLTVRVVGRHGSLAWDDADYLRRGLSNARLVGESAAQVPIRRIADVLLQEQPKPPLLVAWIMMAIPVVGRANLDALIVHGSVLPFALLLLATAGLALRFHGSWASLLAVVMLVSSPSALLFGGKVMVETFLGLWVMLALAMIAEIVVRPSRKTGALLGLALGLACLTKLTAALLLAGAVVLLAWWIVRTNGNRAQPVRALAWATLTCLVLAGPWYAHNLPAAVRFGIYSSRFNLDVEGRSGSIPPLQRLLLLVTDLPGWPLAAILSSAGLILWFRKRQDNVSQETTGEDVAEEQAVARRFRLLVATSILAATIVLMFPHHFDSRFLLPLWPALTVTLSGILGEAIRSLTPRWRLVVGATLAASLAASVMGLIGEPVSTTCWNARGLIDELVTRHGVSSLANVGNTEGWNVCKTGLVNELRENPADCFVLHDLSAETGESLRSRLSRFDAVVVLDPSAFPPGFKEALPALNRGYSAIGEAIKADTELTRVNDLSRTGLPPLTCYVRRRRVVSTNPL